jgi:ATP-binding protein involved in chromosome partitioning
MAREEGMELLARIPIHPEVRETGDDGMPIVIKSPDHPASQAFMEVARRVIAAMPKD